MSYLQARMKPLLKADSLVKRYGDILAVNDISFEINRGEIFGFLGPNGAGKTTAIKIMSGLLKADSGSVTIDSSDSRSSIGICPQHIVLWENLTCLEQVVYMGRMYDLSSYESDRRGRSLLEALGLYEYKDRLARKLSGGMQRRLNIILALIHSPGIVFLDEPQAGLDPQSRILVRDYIRSIKNLTTVVLTTHDMEEAEKLSDRICIIDKGKLLISGTANEIIRTAGHEDLIEADIEGDITHDLIPFLDPELISDITISGTRISFNNKNPLAAMDNVLRTIKEHNLKVNSLQLRRKSLEDIFISLTGRSIRE
ncbi:MAG TPA: ABC transporter ATP-binding protein [Bacteroidales bacterium]|nr:ABC transporter ATP-binding protein [Bacteroidales bacterium]